MDRNLALEAVRVTEAAALASARLMGRGDIAATDRAGAEAMRKAVPARSPSTASIVIGEGEQARQRRAATIGERVGNGNGPEIDVALDPLEGATICATGGFNALSIIAFAERGGFLRCPPTRTWRRSSSAPTAAGVIDLDRSAEREPARPGRSARASTSPT